MEINDHHNLGPYLNPRDLFFDELRWLNRVLAAQVLQLRCINFHEQLKDFRDLFIADEEIDMLIREGIFEKNTKNKNHHQNKNVQLLQEQANDIDRIISKRVNSSLSANKYLPLINLQSAFHLDEIEIKIIIVCLAPQCDTRYSKLYAYLQNDITQKFPSIDLISSLLSEDIDQKLTLLDYFHPLSHLKRFNLVEFVENTYNQNQPQISRHIKVNDRICAFLLGSQFLNPELVPIASIYSSTRDLSTIIEKKELKECIEKFIDWYKKNSNESVLFDFYGASDLSKIDIAAIFARNLGLPLLTIDIDAILHFELPFQEIIKSACIESHLLSSPIYFKNACAIIDVEEKMNLRLSFLKIINEYSYLSFIENKFPLYSEHELSNQTIFHIEFKPLDFSLRQEHWRFNLDLQHRKSSEINIDTLASKFAFDVSQIKYAIATASSIATCRDPENGQITMHDLYEGCRAHSNQKLRTLAQKIIPKYRWDDIVLPSDQMAQLHEISDYAKYKHVVYDEWGFDRKLSLGKGLSALFSGTSGTGKTMAAEIIANELDLDMYKIDLSVIVSKYIGETEKNLSKIFHEAETSNAILFFDEADALFGKRSEVRDSHDRYANIEIGYLLQKMEEYNGIVVLATNMRKNMDEAFIRRMHFMMDFPFPEEYFRLRIWQQIFPPETPLDHDVDFNFLARRFKISGGNIKNITLAAAFFAADDGMVVNMKHLILATKREFQKMGKLCIKADFGQYYELLQD